MLKPFQRRTVEYVYKRMYEDADPAMKFLIADEVALGNTLVAKGIIARQNINLLNVTGDSVGYRDASNAYFGALFVQFSFPVPI